MRTHLQEPCGTGDVTLGRQCGKPSDAQFDSGRLLQFSMTLLSVMTAPQPINKFSNPLETCKHQPIEIAESKRFGDHLKSHHKPYRNCQ
jgi:hypothetical protein